MSDHIKIDKLDLKDGLAYPPPSRVRQRAHITQWQTYQKEYIESIENSDVFWGKKAREYITWIRDFTEVSYGSFEHGDIAWFLHGELNVAMNCIDRHIGTKGDQIAIIWESDEPGVGQKITYKQLLAEVCKIANYMKEKGIRKGDTVAIYMPMIPDLVYVMLACTRIGAIHSIIFAGFSGTALRDRIVDAKSKYIFTADYGRRGGRTLLLKSVVDEAVEGLDFIENVFVFRHPHLTPKYTPPEVPFQLDRDCDMSIDLLQARPYCPCEPMNSEDPLFVLYTSGSTGKPKGLVHTTAGYLLYTLLTTKYVFDLQPNDIYACVADCGWITGHSYAVYGPLANGTTTLLFESTPTYPDFGRYWDLVERYKVTQFYTAPTAIRALMGHSTEYITKYDLSSLLILGSVGEPINPEAWKWYYQNIGKERCAIVDTYWQTETGGHIGTNLPGVVPMKPGSCSLPFFGIEFVLKDEQGGIITRPNTEGRLCISKPWPGLARTVYKNHARYLSVYTQAFPGTYFTGDACKRDEDGYYWIIGRIDDVLTTAGHRIGTAEIESALVSHQFVAEAAVVGFPHKIRGEGICCYVTLVSGVEPSKGLKEGLAIQVRRTIGAFAKPDIIICTPSLPKTRSGKIMRRILRKIACGEESSIGDVSTLADPNVVTDIITLYKGEMADKDF